MSLGALVDASTGASVVAAVGASVGTSIGEITACCACVAWAGASLDALEARLIWYLCIGAESSCDR